MPTDPIESLGPGWIVDERARQRIARRVAFDMTGHVPLPGEDRRHRLDSLPGVPAGDD